LRDVPRPDAVGRTTARSESHPISLMGAERSGAPRLGGVDGASTVIAWMARDKIGLCAEAHAALLATGMGSPKGGDAGRCYDCSCDWRLRSRQPGRRRVAKKMDGRGLTPVLFSFLTPPAGRAELGEFEDAVISKTFGDVPVDFRFGM
jgi:hypothetical protein